MRSILVVFSLFLFTGVALAQGAPSQAPAHAVVVQPDQLTWSPAPPSLPAGAKAAVLEGDPRQPGPFTMRLLLPDGYRVPPHFHAGVERVTVIQGTFQLGMGDKFDESALTSLPAGGFVAMQPGTLHFAKAKGNTTLQLNGTGPWKLTYVNASDDPQKQTQQ